MIQDSKNKVYVDYGKHTMVYQYVDYGKHTMVYQLHDVTYHIDFGRDEIRYNGNCINVSKNNQHIYISHKNIYLSVYYIEKILLKNENQIKIENKTAIIS